MPVNECIPFYDPGSDITADVATAVVGKRFVAISADRQAGGPAGISDAALGGNVKVAPCGAGLKAFGVAAYDQVATSGSAVKKVPVYRAPKVVPVTADGAIAAGAEVEVGALGKAKTVGTGIKVGLCLTAAADGADAQIALYL